MSTALGRRPPQVVPTCAHCGQDVPDPLFREAADRQFCCSGCRQVSTLLREWGFDQYYRLIARQGGSIEPARVSGRSFDDFDDDQLQAEATSVVAGDRRRIRLYLENVHCAACVWLVERLPSVLPGVDEVRLSLGSAVADVTWRPSQARLSTVARALDRIGYTPHVHTASRAHEARRSEDRSTLARLGIAVACAMNLMFVSGALYAGEFSGMAAPYESFFRWFSLGIFLPVMLFSARPFFQTAIAGLRAAVVHIDLPIAIGIAAGFAASAVNVIRGSGVLWFDSLAMLIAALLGARQLQRSAQRMAIERADSLRGVAFLEFARRLDGRGVAATAIEVPLTALRPGDRVEVRSGELVPVDGVVLLGRSTLDNAVLTGETTPLPVVPGDAVTAGATNLGGALTVRVDATGERTRVGALLSLVQEALTRKPRLLEATDAMARRFVTALLLVAAATAVIVALQRGPDAAVARIVALLVVSCPCALGLSVPLAMSVALMRAARAGIFIKNPDALERLPRVATILLDKTGTLTEGRATLARWHGSESALALARALEAQSSHTVARAFQVSRPLQLVRAIADVREIPGRGISGRLDGLLVRVGNRAYIETEGAFMPRSIQQATASMLKDGLSPVFVTIDNEVVGVAGIGAALRTDSRHTVAALQARGLRVCILSGDHHDVVSRVGAELGLDVGDVHGGLTPEAKRDMVAAIKAASDPTASVVMVGDGVNDAAALAMADVGIVVQGGMGATIVAADVVFTRAGVQPLLDLLDGSRRLRRVVRRNIGFSLCYNLAASSLALAGVVGPLLAALLMPASSLIVVLSSALTRTFTRPLPTGRA